MDPIEIESVETPSLDAPLFIEGLPGVGLVGTLAADLLVEEFDGQPVRHIYSEYLPPAISVDDDGIAQLASLTVYAVEADGRDLLVLAGDSQAQDVVGQYRLADAVLDIAAEFSVEGIVTIGGLGTGEPVDDYPVVGAVPERFDALRAPLEDAGVRFTREEPGNIVGMSGLLVGLGARRGFDTAGLLGTTPGYHVDPASARAVLDVLQAAFGFTVDVDRLEEQAEQVHALLEQLQSFQEPQPSPGGEDLRYIG